ncbi:MAG: DoxX family protein [Pseudorhodoplanes sp.]|nr:DoxX family protein [Pseudorhodoplanes sp.]
MATRSSHPALSNADSFATGSADLLLLIGRILLGQLFLLAGWGNLTNVAGATAYFNSLGLPAADMMPYLVGLLEVLLGLALVLGVATRYAAIAAFLFVLATTVIAHRYWTYPAAQQVAQYNSFLKNLAIMGGALYVLAFGAGRFSVDASLAKK